ncbi:MAG TPA: S-layer homology domain-containing protein [Methylomusa anaerophila]|uniref:Outer membrane protein alpha n=1 Tax=Methylomusa anaerophila TaxID=1930071 RepID=A0A348AKI9_9FIRM|nr:S-layer homology domain-containing protein [Methylomusa anaerophila]BBB91587.1 outer membrane protein alpha precursor [Methylomusa anaerophila]HML89475.1 S-layer homology domain-containing protein [Methylomusa anaerophila]
MKKQVALALAAAFTLSVAGTALAAPANPFVDVPANHWSYDAVNKLVKAGVVSGYGDGTYKGDRTLTRYEMATVVAKAMANSEKADAETKATIDKLQTEFASELNNLGVRVSNLEKNASSIKFSGDARIRFQENNSLQGNSNNGPDRSRFQERIRVNLAADVADNLKFNGRLRWESQSNETTSTEPRSKTAAVQFDIANFQYTNGGFGLGIGRFEPTIGQGLMLKQDNIDGFTTSYNFDKNVKLTGYLVDVSQAQNNNLWVDGNSATKDAHNAYIADLAVKVSPVVNATASYLGTMSGDNYRYRNWAVGANAKLGLFKVTGEYVKNNYNMDGITSPQRDAWWGKLEYQGTDWKKPGSYGLSVEYYNIGKNAIDGSLTALDYSTFGVGIKGWQYGFEYMLAKNAKLRGFVGDFRPYDKGISNYDFNTAYTLQTEFRF